jgi:putative oligomerization/nucleic acid binding protein
MGRRRIPYVTASLADGLRRLMELREEGVLTGEEFEAAKAGLFPVAPIWLRQELRKLTDLHEEGVLTDEEFEVARSTVTTIPINEVMDIPAGDTHVVYVIPDFLLARMANSDSEFRRRAPS